MANSNDHIIRARAPLRISFAGGGSDVSPYVDQHGAEVLNATINRYAYVTVVPNDSGTIRLQSLDYGNEVVYEEQEGVPPFDHQMDLAKGVIKHIGIDRTLGGFNLFTHVDCPPGSGLGASSTLVVALIGAFDQWLHLGLDRYEIARMAFEIERLELGMSGGRQDQYTAAFGGFNFMEFSGDSALVNPLRITQAGISELEYALVLAYTGQSRVSSEIIADQMKHVDQGAADTIEATHRTRALAATLKQALLRGEYEKFGALLHEGWMAKKEMSGLISNPFIDTLYESARSAGALGGKISGAGGGGFMYFFAGYDRRHAVIDALAAHGAEVVHFGFSTVGMEAWVR